jgi:hypothetical protein
LRGDLKKKKTVGLQASHSFMNGQLFLRVNNGHAMGNPSVL